VSFICVRIQRKRQGEDGGQGSGAREEKVTMKVVVDGMKYIIIEDRSSGGNLGQIEQDGLGVNERMMEKEKQD